MMSAAFSATARRSPLVLLMQKLDQRNAGLDHGVSLGLWLKSTATDTLDGHPGHTADAARKSTKSGR